MAQYIRNAIRDPYKITRFIRWSLDGTLYRRYQFNHWRNSSPIALISFPKSGVTWFRTMVGYAIQQHYKTDADYYSRAQTKQAQLPQMFFAHEDARGISSYADVLTRRAKNFGGKKVILVSRDIRDTMVSYYYYRSKRRQDFDMEMPDFLRDSMFGMDAACLFYKSWYDCLPHLSDLLLVRYEHLQQCPQETLHQVLDYIGAAEISEESVQQAVEYAAFENMKKREQDNLIPQISRDLNDNTSPTADSAFVRKGKIHAYADDLSADDLAYIERRIQELAAPHDWMIYDPQTMQGVCR